MKINGRKRNSNSNKVIFFTRAIEKKCIEQVIVKVWVILAGTITVW
jgi:hypothetical protein